MIDWTALIGQAPGIAAVVFVVVVFARIAKQFLHFIERQNDKREAVNKFNIRTLDENTRYLVKNYDILKRVERRLNEMDN